MARNRLLALLAGLSLALSAGADTLLLEGLDQANSSKDQRPSRGMSMQSVETNWGSPMRRSGPVGDPPIATWEYGDFVVYFEYEHVIHAVNRKTG